MTEEIREIEVRIRVPFHDLDPMNVVWHGNYLKYFEIARERLMAENGVDLMKYFEKTGWLFPISKSQVKHIRPLKYGDDFICKATLVEVNRKIVLDFEIRQADGGEICAKGRTEQLAVKQPNFQLEFSIPEDLQKALGFVPE